MNLSESTSPSNFYAHPTRRAPKNISKCSLVKFDNNDDNDESWQKWQYLCSPRSSSCSGNLSVLAVRPGWYEFSVNSLFITIILIIILHYNPKNLAERIKGMKNKTDSSKTDSSKIMVMVSNLIDFFVCLRPAFKLNVWSWFVYLLR